jgi:hypothetical protein
MKSHKGYLLALTAGFFRSHCFCSHLQKPNSSTLRPTAGPSAPGTTFSILACQPAANTSTTLLRKRRRPWPPIGWVESMAHSAQFLLQLPETFSRMWEELPDNSSIKYLVGTATPIASQ